MNAFPQSPSAMNGTAPAAASERRARHRRDPRRTRLRRRAGRALMALALAASVLAAGPSPVQGAAAEVETPNRLAGADRYATAVEIAEAYVAEVQRDTSRITVDTVVLTSGLDAHFGYALPTPALAKLHGAPVLLTRPDSLPSVVTTFLTRPEITTVYIVGDAAVVSAAVERDVAAISGVTVRRVANVDTSVAAAVAIAQLVGWTPGSPGEFRGGYGRTALLATGENFADALAVGPLAYRGEHPILLTPSSELPAAVSAFLRDSRTEHVIILGGTAAVSADVENSVKSLGVTVDRWQGADRFGTAIDIAEALLGFDTPDDCFDDSGELGLAYGWRSPDAIVSGPLLGELCAPLLLTERDVLPLTVADFLESDDWVTGDSSGKLRFTVFGGTAAVGSGAVDDATSAAALVALGATIEAYEGGCHFTVTFSEPVNRADAGDITHYLSGNTAFASGDGAVYVGTGPNTTRAIVKLGSQANGDDASVPVTCTSRLQARDRIGIVGGDIHAAADNRRVPRIEYFVVDDETPPVLTLNAPQGGSKVWVESNEPLQATDNGDVEIEFKRTGIDSGTATAAVTAGSVRFEVDVPSGFDPLKIGDTVSIAADQLRDLAGNATVAIRSVVARDTTAPQVRQITVTEPSAVAEASVTLRASRGQDALDALTLRAKDGGAADGATGNDWTIDLDTRTSPPSAWSSAQKASVQVSTATRRILVVALSTASVHDVYTVLTGHTLLSSLFDITQPGQNSDVPIDTGGRVRFSGGTSTVDLTVYWNEVVNDCTEPSNNEPDRRPRVRLVEIDSEGDGTTDFDLDGFTFGGSDVTFVDGDSGDSIIVGRATCDTTTSGVRPGTLVARLQSASIDNLPSTRSIALVRSGAVTDLAGNANARQTGVRLVRP